MSRVFLTGLLILLAVGCRTSSSSATRDLAIDSSPGGKFSLYTSTGEGRIGRYICPASTWSQQQRINTTECALKGEALSVEFSTKLKELYAEINDGEISQSESRMADKILEVIESDEPLSARLYELTRRHLALERMLTLIPLALGEATIPVEPQVCTRDINSYGFPSACSCPAGGAYNPRVGSCEDGPQPNRCTRDFNRWGHPSSCICPDGYRYTGQTGQCSEQTATYRVAIMGSGSQVFANVVRESAGQEQAESLARNIECEVIRGFGAIGGTSRIDCVKDGFDVRLRSHRGSYTGDLTIATNQINVRGGLRCASPQISITPVQPPVGGQAEYVLTKCVMTDDDNTGEIDCNARPAEPGFCCAAETPSCIACRDQSNRAAELLDRWEESCASDPVVDCDTRPPPPMACCMAETPGCRSCSERSARMAAELAQWEDQCQEDGVPCEREIALICDPPQVDGCLLTGADATRVHKCVEPSQPSDGVPCEREVLLGCQPPMVDGCTLAGSDATRVHRCVQPEGSAGELNGYNFEGEVTCNPLPDGWACPQVVTPEMDACYEVGGRSLYCEGCAILCDRPISSTLE